MKARPGRQALAQKLSTVRHAARIAEIARVQLGSLTAQAESLERLPYPTQQPNPMSVKFNRVRDDVKAATAALVAAWDELAKFAVDAEQKHADTAKKLLRR